jgi:hypothetical protein
MVQMKEQPGMFTKVTQLPSDAQVAYFTGVIRNNYPKAVWF